MGATKASNAATRNILFSNMTISLPFGVIELLSDYDLSI